MTVHKDYQGLRFILLPLAAYAPQACCGGDAQEKGCSGLN